MDPKDQFSEELQRSELPTLWKIPDPMWEQIEPILPPEKEPGTPGRPPVPFRTVLDGILFVLRTGCHRNVVPSAFGSGSTCHRRFQEWIEANYLDRVIARMLRLYDEIREINWHWQSADTKLLPAPLGGEKTGPNPTDLGKQGTKRHLLIDGEGVPLSIHLTKANRHDLKGLSSLLEEKHLIERPDPEESPEKRPQHLCLDKAYDAKETDELLDELSYTGHVKRKNQNEDDTEKDAGGTSDKTASEEDPSENAGIGEPVYPARRWKVERSISWSFDLRKLRTRWAKKAANYRGLWLLAIGLIIYRRIILG